MNDEVVIIDEEQMPEADRMFWVKHWQTHAFAADKMAKFGHCVNLANQLQLNGVKFDLHIQTISPKISGWLITSVTEDQEFTDSQDLYILLRLALNALEEYRKENHEDSTKPV